MHKGWYRSLAGIGEDRPGEQVVLLGTASRGPVIEPVYVAGPEHAARLFGTSGTLFGGYRLAHTVNPQAIYYLMRLNGGQASLVVSLATDDEPHVFALEAVEAGSPYNNVAARVEDGVLVVAWAGGRNVYDLAQLATLGELADQINRDASLGYSPVTASALPAEAPSAGLAGPLGDWRPLTGGEDAVAPSRNELYSLLAQAYARLEGLRTDIVVPLGAFFDDVLASYEYGAGESIYGAAWYTGSSDRLNLFENGQRATFHGQLIDFCRRQSARGLMCHGVMGLRPMPEEKYLAESDYDYIAGLVGVSCLATREGFVSGEEDLGHHVSLVLGDLALDGEYPSGAAAYAALLAAAGTETTTGMPVANLERQRAQLDDRAIRYAADSGLVTFGQTPKKGLMVAAGVTAAPAGRPLHYIANVRTAQYVINTLRLALDPYIGTVHGIIPVRDAVERTVEEVLRSAAQAGLVRSYAYNLRLRRLDAASVALDIDLTFRARYAVEDISVTTTVVAPAQ